MDNYWEGVRNRLKSLGKAAFRMAGTAVSSVPAVQHKVSELRQKLFYKVLLYTEKKLDETYKNTIINALINLGINVLGILTLVFKPFGIFWSRIVSISFFAVSFGFFVYRCVMFVKNYGKLCYTVGKDIYKEKSIRKGIRNYVFAEYPKVEKVYKIVNRFQPYVPVLEEIPEIEEIVSVIIGFFWKKVVFFFSIFAVYTMIFYWILKPYLICHFGF